MSNWFKCKKEVLLLIEKEGDIIVSLDTIIMIWKVHSIFPFDHTYYASYSYGISTVTHRWKMSRQILSKSRKSLCLRTKRRSHRRDVKRSTTTIQISFRRGVGNDYSRQISLLWFLTVVIYYWYLLVVLCFFCPESFWFFLLISR